MPTNFNLGLFGKLYLDTIVYLESFNSGETNVSTLTKKTTGGIYNILNANLPCITSYCFHDSEVEAFIISESDSSKRSSILHSFKKDKKPKINQAPLDWLHVAYIDDLCYPESLNDVRVKFSLDFCTLDPREKYLHLIEKASLIFDSKERSHLYQSLKFKTPLILHDKHGCECIVNGEVASRGFTEPVDNIHVNGAGDIFAGIFISEYYNSTLDNAVKSTARRTSSYLIQ